MRFVEDKGGEFHRVDLLDNIIPQKDSGWSAHKDGDGGDGRYQFWGTCDHVIDPVISTIPALPGTYRVDVEIDDVPVLLQEPVIGWATHSSGYVAAMVMTIDLWTEFSAVLHPDGRVTSNHSVWDSVDDYFECTVDRISRNHERMARATAEDVLLRLREFRDDQGHGMEAMIEVMCQFTPTKKFTDVEPEDYRALIEALDRAHRHLSRKATCPRAIAS